MEVMVMEYGGKKEELWEGKSGTKWKHKTKEDNFWVMKNLNTQEHNMPSDGGCERIMTGNDTDKLTLENWRDERLKILAKIK